MDEKMRIAIYGAGSLGTVLGAYLTKAYPETELINRNQAHIEALRRNGAQITGSVEMNVPVKALLPEEMTGVYDLIFLMTKQLNNRKTAEFLKPFLGDNGVLCTLQNGIPEPLLAEVLGNDRVLGATVAWGATMTSPGTVVLTSDANSMTFGMGQNNAAGEERTALVRTVLEHMCPVEYEPDFEGARWSKLLINAAFSGLGTVIGGTFGDVAADKKTRRVAQYVIKECIDVGHAAGVSFAPVQGKDIVKLLYFKGTFKRAVSFAIIPLAIKKHRLLKPSMLQDLEKGKPCEIGAINGVVCHFAQKTGVSAPFNAKIVEIIHRIEENKSSCGYENIAEFDALLKP